MRITAGKYKGREVFFPKSKMPTRPAMALMREALFSILGLSVTHSTWADVFCGSGIVGLEALSRGARAVHFVDKDKSKQATLKRNLSLVEEESEVFFQDAVSFLKQARESYDFIYLDPPFPLLEKSHLLLIAKEALGRTNPKGVIILHYPAQEEITPPEGLISYKKKKYGGSHLEFFHLGER